MIAVMRSHCVTGYCPNQYKILRISRKKSPNLLLRRVRLVIQHEMKQGQREVKQGK